MYLVVQVFRATHGKAQVWGKAPTYITAKYTPADGQEKTSLLLTSGRVAVGFDCEQGTVHWAVALAACALCEAIVSWQPS